MAENQRYDNIPDGKEANDQNKDRDVIQNLTEMFGRGEISLAEMWVRIEQIIDSQYFRQKLIEPISYPNGFPVEKV